MRAIRINMRYRSWRHACKVMLVIRRRAGESLLIGENVELEVLDIGANQVKLGIRAPREVPVLRKEIQLTRQQNQAASQTLPPTAIETLREALGSRTSRTSRT